ncbi:GntR family transcriptional regulator [Paenibacillus sp. P96]|uniref:GntR family transcriptional regulator n=1 Tax=Paenibacillus zeirhizosphaerae TaxID=2987519 RepID=A0ABT9FR03_9BACL|nr:GntR family transcriptional regulator [Paenibacillus sp. P96]MDP4097142.1 GntR family transcriptional regulator [Paenibacillus sp. P96]
MKALYEQVYQALKQDIVSGKYKVGDRVPSEKELSEGFRVSRITSKKALEKLVKDGTVYRQRGKGTFVSGNQKAHRTIQDRERKPLFGLIVTEFDDTYGAKLISSIEEAADGKCFVILKRSLGQPAKEEKMIKELLEFGVDGLLIYPAEADHYSSEILKMVVNRFPFVLIDRVFKGVAATSVSTDNTAAAKMGTEYLLGLGHEHIGILSPRAIGITTVEDRLDGIVQAYAERNVIVNRQLWLTAIESTQPSSGATIDQDIDEIQRHLIRNPHITALFALEYNIALLAKRAAEQLGMRVPEDLSILCFDGPERSLQSWNFTRILQDEKALGELAIRRLLEMMEGEFTYRQDCLPATLVAGSSVVKNAGRPVHGA